MATASPLISPSSEKRFWSTLRNRVETILEARNSSNLTSISSTDNGESKRLKEDTMLLFRGFDSIAYSISQLNNSIDTALQGARDLAKPPTLSDIVQSTTNETRDNDGPKQENDEGSAEQGNTTKKRKIDDVCSGNNQQEKESSPSLFAGKEQKTQLQKVKNLAVSMATKSASLARELKSVKSDLCFMQERCALLEEENRRLRDGVSKDNRPDEDDLVRLQLEALLAEKSRLATENANLTRENQCLRQLVEYHQFTTEDLTASYDQAIHGLALDFSSPVDQDHLQTPRGIDSFEFQTPLHERFSEEDQVLPEDHKSF